MGQRKIMTGVLKQNSMGQWVVMVDGRGFANVGNPGHITERQKYQLQPVRFEYDGHFAWLI